MGFKKKQQIVAQHLIIALVCFLFLYWRQWAVFEIDEILKNITLRN